MSSIDYFTEKAEYRQIYAVHTMPLDDEIFKEIYFDSMDAVVLEGYHSEEWFEKLWQSQLKKNEEVLFQVIQRTGKPIYIVDVLTTRGGRGFEQVATILPDFLGFYGLLNGGLKIGKQIREEYEMTRREFFKFWGVQTAKVAGGAYLGSHSFHQYYTMHTGDNPEWLARVNSSRMHIIPTPQFELRNAITARKIEEYIVPELEQKLNRKPRLVLVYGAGHSGLKEDLQYPQLRDRVIELYAGMGFPGIDRTYLDTVTNLIISENGEYLLRHREANLFK